MKYVWPVLVAAWKVAVWWITRNKEKDAKREKLQKALKGAVTNRDIDRLRSELRSE